MKKITTYLIIGLIGLIGIGATSMYQAIRHDATLSGDGTDASPLGIDTSGSGKIATKYQLATDGGSTPGIDDVLAVGQDFTSSRILNHKGWGFAIKSDADVGYVNIAAGETDGTSAHMFLNNDGANTWEIGQIDGALLKSDGASTTSLDNTAHTGFFGINTSSPDKALTVVGDASISGTINGVKRYVALLTQSGSGNPTVTTTLVNTLGFTPTFVRDDVGVTLVQSSAGFTADKTIAYGSTNVAGGYTVFYGGTSEIDLIFTSDDWTATLIIEIYP